MPTALPFEPEYVALVRELFEKTIAFNRVLGLKVDSVAAGGVSGHIDMRPELISHAALGRLHGGVISAALDTMGGLAIVAATCARHMDEPPLVRIQRFMKLGTIDLRIDYLRPATGSRFTMAAEVMRLGSRVASTRMTFYGAGDKLLATGSGAYIVS